MGSAGERQDPRPIVERREPARFRRPGVTRRTLRPLAAVGLLALIACLGPWAVGAASAAAPSGDPVWGADVSYPQCRKPLDGGQAFALVGVNGGVPGTSNPCLAQELGWAGTSSGATVHDKVQLYANTGNPGAVGSPAWPRAGSNRYGSCDGTNSLPCAYQYGWERARDDATGRGVRDPEAYMWWLDVEVANTWDRTGPDRNVAVLEGMTEYFRSIGARGVGLYSTRVMWHQVVGTAVGAQSSLNGLSNWRPLGSTLEAAKGGCGLAPLTPGGRIEITQYVARGPGDAEARDYDFSCI